MKGRGRGLTVKPMPPVPSPMAGLSLTTLRELAQVRGLDLVVAADGHARDEWAAI